MKLKEYICPRIDILVSGDLCEVIEVIRTSSKEPDVDDQAKRGAVWDDEPDDDEWELYPTKSNYPKSVWDD